MKLTSKCKQYLHYFTLQQEKAWSHEGCDSLRMVATSYRKWTQITRTICIFGHTCETSLRLIYHLSQVNVRRPCDGRNWSYNYLPLTASDRKNVCHRPHASLRSPAAYIWHMCDHPCSAYDIPAITCVHRMDVVCLSACCPKYLYCSVFVLRYAFTVRKDANYIFAVS